MVRTNRVRAGVRLRRRVGGSPAHDYLFIPAYLFTPIYSQHTRDYSNFVLI